MVRTFLLIPVRFCFVGCSALWRLPRVRRKHPSHKENQDVYCCHLARQRPEHNLADPPKSANEQLEVKNGSNVVLLRPSFHVVVWVASHSAPRSGTYAMLRSSALPRGCHFRVFAVTYVAF
jgi:hypothetical protein